MIWNPEYECMERGELHALQLRRLQMTVAWVYDRVPHYRAQLDAHAVRPRDIRTLDDVRRLPFTDKSALRDTYPFGMFAVPLDEVVRLHSSSGTTGKPVVVGYTRGDINTWTEMTARIGAAAGVTRGDLVDMSFLYGMFTGGWGMHYGLERIGATIIPAGSGNTERHIMMMQDFGTTVLVSTPSYALYLAEVGERMGVEFRDLPLRLGLFGGEPCSVAAKREIEDRLGIKATDNYGLSEVMGPGVSGECECECGLHIAEDHVLWEIVDPETGEPVAPGEQGELVFTSLTKEAFPVLRYRTHDLTTVTTERCECGRSLARMERVRSRTDDMLIVRGVNVFPSAVREVVNEFAPAVTGVIMIRPRAAGVRQEPPLPVRVEVADGVATDGLAERIRARLRDKLVVTTEIELAAAGSLPRSEYKSKLVEASDRRER
jgi:phenylacetate-CoA ligase